MSRTRARPLAQLFAAGLLLFSLVGARHRSAPVAAARPTSVEATNLSRAVAIVQHEGYPELRVNGVPFFVHSGAFFYDRVPRDLWERVLDRYRTVGINTIEIYIPWNWHEPREGELDFDGHTNPRRDLRALLRLVSEKGFKLIARPGPQILNEWRHGGYPGWLLERPEYHMNLVDRLEGRYPPFSYLNTRDAEAAAKELLENPAHMAYARKWLETVARELAPYSSSRSVPVHPVAQAGSGREVSGPLLFVQLEDDLAIGRTNTVGPMFWLYLDALHQMLEAGGLDTPVFINPTDMRVSAEGSSLARPIGVMGQWYMSPGEAGEGRSPQLTAEDASNIEFFVEELKTQPSFPPVFIEYQAGWYCPADDDRPLASPPENTLLSSRLAIAYGLHGLNYFPLEDTYTPAGYSVPWASRSYRWDAAVDPNGNYGPRARSVARNSQLLRQWGEWLAASHERVDFGIVYPVGAYPQELLNASDILHVSGTVLRLERVGQLASLSSEPVDPEYQPVEQLLRHAVLLLPVSEAPQFELSEKAQRTLVEYVRHGGVLIYFPSQPAGRILQEFWATPPSSGPPAFSAISRQWSFGAGQVIESTKDFTSWVELDRSFAENRSQQEAGWATQVLEEFLGAARVRPVVQRASGAGSPDLIVTELVSNDGTRLLGTRSGGTGLLSVTNIGDTPVDEDLAVLAPGSSARMQGNPYLPVRIVVPAKESLLLPLMQPLCVTETPATDCRDVVISAGAEFLHADRKGNTLELKFYTPTRASTRIKLEDRPSHAMLEEAKAGAKWDPDLRELEIELPRGASPQFLRTLNIALPYRPHVPEEPVVRNRPSGGFEYTVADAVRLPVGEGATSLLPDPPLLALDASHPAKLIFQVINPDQQQYHDFSLRVEGPLHSTAGLRVPAGGTAFVTLKLKTTAGQETDLSGIQPTPDGLVHGTVEIHSGSERMKSPILFALVRPGAVSHYWFDFDRDGANEWVLENSALRLIVSPESGGRALALISKDLNLNLITSVGALRDNFSYAINPPGVTAGRAGGRYGLFNRPYRAEWAEEQGTPALRMSYDAPDILPAGAKIEKTVRLETTDTMRVDYRVQLFPSGSAVGTEHSPQAFVAVNSVPAILQADRSTRFCWMAGSAGVHCQTFSPEHAAVELPAESSRLEVHTPGRPGLALEWNCVKPSAQSCGQMRIEMKRSSALLKLQFPPLAPSGEPGEYSVRFRVVPAEEAGAQ